MPVCKWGGDERREVPNPAVGTGDDADGTTGMARYCTQVNQAPRLATDHPWGPSLAVPSMFGRVIL